MLNIIKTSFFFIKTSLSKFAFILTLVIYIYPQLTLAKDEAVNGLSSFVSSCLNKLPEAINKMNSQKSERANTIIQHESTVREEIFNNAQQATVELRDAIQQFQEQENDLQNQIDEIKSQRRTATRNLKRTFSTLMNTCEAQGDEVRTTGLASNQSRIHQGDVGGAITADYEAAKRGRETEFNCKVRKSNIREMNLAQQEYNDIMLDLEEKEAQFNRAINRARSATIENQRIITLQRDQKELYLESELAHQARIAKRAYHNIEKRSIAGTLLDATLCANGAKKENNQFVCPSGNRECETFMKRAKDSAGVYQ